MFTSLKSRLPGGADASANPLPIILAGPILRKVTPSTVTVWLALSQPAKVTVDVYSVDPLVGKALATGNRPSVKIGQNLHVACVTAHLVAGQSNLTGGTNIYSYNLTFTTASGDIPLNKAIGASGTAAYAYGARQMPSFALPPADLESVRLIQGSCRKPNAEGPDALAMLDDIIAASVDNPLARPHQLLLTGDQIYADEVSDILLLMLTDAAGVLLDPQERLPGPNGSEFLATSAPPTSRTDLIQKEAKLTTDDTRSHLMSFGEFVAMYLFAWSDVLWPKTLPDWSDLILLEPIKDKQDWAAGVLNLMGEITTKTARVDIFRQTLIKVRRALANVPTAMILDDHEITDDFNMLPIFCTGVYGSALGTRIIQNGLAAYALCQHWGNAPEQFEPSTALDGKDPAGVWLLNQFNTSSYDKFSDNPTLMTTLGLHAPAQLQQGTTSDNLQWRSSTFAVFHDVGKRAPSADGSCWLDSSSLLYHYSLEATAYQIIVTDSRTWRAFPRGGDYSPPDLIAYSQLPFQIGKTPSLNNRQLFVVVTTNMPPAPPIRQGARDVPTLVKLGGGVGLYYEDFYDSWQIERIDCGRVFAEVSRKFPKSGTGSYSGGVVLLSGDVHASMASRIAYSATAQQIGDAAGSPSKAELTFAQLIGSALHNQGDDSKAQHTLGYAYVPPHMVGGVDVLKHLKQPIILTEGFVGWNPITTPAGQRFAVRHWEQSGHEGDSDVLFVSDRCTSTLREEELHDIWDWKITHVLATPHYQMRLDYLKVTDSGGYSKEPAAASTSSDPLQKTADAAHAYDGYIRGQRRGSEIVGLNNIGEITFVRAAPGSFVGPQLLVRYLVHWFEDKQKKFVRYDVSLDVGDQAYKQLPYPS